MTRRSAYLVGLIAFGGSGFYTFVYLYRWEWNRALMAGLLFIAAEIALAAVAVFERIRSLERRLDETAGTPSPLVTGSPDTLTRIRQTAPRREPFRWLDDTDGLNVFVPFLFGAGFLASGLAWLVERASGATAIPVLERRLASALQPIAFPAGGLLGSTAPEPVARRAERTALGKQVAALLLALAAGTIGVDILGDATQNRPDVVAPGSTSRLVLDVRTKGTGHPAERAVLAVWGACQTATGSRRDGDITPLGDGRYALTLAPALGKHGERRLRGCLQDAVLDNVQATVISVR